MPKYRLNFNNRVFEINSETDLGTEDFDKIVADLDNQTSKTRPPQHIQGKDLDISGTSEIPNISQIENNINRNLNIIKKELNQASEKWSFKNFFPEQYNPDKVNTAMDNIYSEYKKAEKQGLNLPKTPELESIIENYGDWSAFNITKPILSSDDTHIEKIKDIVERKAKKKSIPAELNKTIQKMVMPFDENINAYETEKQNISAMPEEQQFKTKAGKIIFKNEYLNQIESRQKEFKKQRDLINNVLNAYITELNKKLVNPTTDEIKKQYAVLSWANDLKKDEIKELQPKEKIDIQFAQDFFKTLTKEDVEKAGYKDEDLKEKLSKNWKQYLVDIGSVFNTPAFIINIALKGGSALEKRAKVESAFKRQTEPEKYQNEIEYWNNFEKNVADYKNLSDYEKNQLWEDKPSYIEINKNEFWNYINNPQLIKNSKNKIIQTQQEDEKIINDIIDNRIKSHLKIGDTSAVSIVEGIIDIIGYAKGMGLAKGALKGDWLEKKILDRLFTTAGITAKQAEKIFVKNLIDKSLRFGAKLGTNVIPTLLQQL